MVMYQYAIVVKSVTYYVYIDIYHDILFLAVERSVFTGRESMVSPRLTFC